VVEDLEQALAGHPLQTEEGGVARGCLDGLAQGRELAEELGGAGVGVSTFPV
jgi:hypothetical protein